MCPTLYVKTYPGPKKFPSVLYLASLPNSVFPVCADADSRGYGDTTTTTISLRDSMTIFLLFLGTSYTNLTSFSIERFTWTLLLNHTLELFTRDSPLFVLFLYGCLA